MSGIQEQKGADHWTEQMARAEKLIATDPDSALTLSLDLEAHLDELGQRADRVRALMILGRTKQALGDFPSALATFHKAQELVDDSTDEKSDDPALVLVRADVLGDIGLLHYALRDYDRSVEYYNKVLRILDGIQETGLDKEVEQRKVRAFNNLAGVYLQRSDFAGALPYYEQAAEMNRALGDPRNESALQNNIGICHMEIGDRDKADQCFLRSLALRKESGDVAGQAQVLNNLGKNLVLAGRFREALDRYRQALAMGRSSSSGASVAVSLESLASVYDTLGDYKSAFRTFREFKQLNDSLNNESNRAAIAKMELGYRQQKEREKLQQEIQRKEAEHARQRDLNIALVIVLFLLLLSGFLLFKVMRARVRNGRLEQDKLRLESEKLEAEQTALKEDLDARDRELAANALFLLKKNEIISNIAERLLKAKATFRQENQQIIQEIVRDLNASKDDDSWKEFEAHFTRVHGSFYQTLQERFPSLTPNERKLCAFLRLNLSTKDISAITQQSLNSITVARSRLRKKLGIEGEEANLVDFLLSI